MEVSGYMFREKISELLEERDILAKQFTSNIKQFDNAEYGTKTNLEELFGRYHRAELKVCKLQSEQSRFNTIVKVQGPDGEISLSEATKAVSIENRASGLWKSVAHGGKKLSRFERREPATVRDKEKVYAKEAVGFEVALGKKRDHTRRANKFRQAIVEGNSTKIELEIDRALFD